MTVEALIERDAINGIEQLMSRVRDLENNDYYVPVSKTGATSNPPTQVELDGILGAPSTYNSHTVALVNDTTNSRQWLCYGDTTTDDWYFVTVNANYRPGFNSIIPAITVTNNPAFTPGYYTITGVPTYAIGVSLNMTGTDVVPGSTAEAHPDLGGGSVVGNDLNLITQVSGVQNSVSGVIPTSIVQGNQVYLNRTGLGWTSLSVTCNGFWI